MSLSDHTALPPTFATAEIERLRRLLWECHRAASDGIPVPFERWLTGGGPEEMPGDVRELRDAYDTVCEERDAALPRKEQS